MMFYIPSIIQLPIKKIITGNNAQINHGVRCVVVASYYSFKMELQGNTQNE